MTCARPLARPGLLFLIAHCRTGEAQGVADLAYLWSRSSYGGPLSLDDRLRQLEQLGLVYRTTEEPDQATGALFSTYFELTKLGWQHLSCRDEHPHLWRGL